MRRFAEALVQATLVGVATYCLARFLLVPDGPRDPHLFAAACAFGAVFGTLMGSRS